MMSFTRVRNTHKLKQTIILNTDITTPTAFIFHSPRLSPQSFYAFTLITSCVHTLSSSSIYLVCIFRVSWDLPKLLNLSSSIFLSISSYPDFFKDDMINSYTLTEFKWLRLIIHIIDGWWYGVWPSRVLCSVLYCWVQKHPVLWSGAEAKARKLL